MPETFNSKPSITIGGKSYPIFPKPTLARWAEAARTKGFTIVARVQDRYFVALKCDRCGELTKTRHFVVTNSQPLCEPCLEAAWAGAATAAGLTFLRRDPDRHYGWFRAECGHEVRRQFELIGRAAAGRAGLRCETCHAAREAAEAEARGWRLVGPDSDGNPNYRMYAHTDCGGEPQRIARANMQTGRFSCGHCDEGWVGEPSGIYLMRFTLEDGDVVVKAGYSRDPYSRLHHQLRCGSDQICELVRVVQMPTGQAAIRAEKHLHHRLRTEFPDAIVPHERFSSMIRVKSEIYRAEVEPRIHELLDEIEAGLPAAALRAPVPGLAPALNLARKSRRMRRDAGPRPA